MAFPMRALVDELRERSGVARGAPGAAGAAAASRGRGDAPRPSLVYWRPIVAAGHHAFLGRSDYPHAHGGPIRAAAGAGAGGGRREIDCR